MSLPEPAWLEQALRREADLAFVILSWIFVFFRFWHAFEHVTANHVRRRALIFFGSAGTLIAMWVVTAIRILFAI